MSKERTNRSAEAVKQIRQSIENDYRRNSDLFDEIDYKRVLTDDWFVKRFLLINKRKVDIGYKGLKDALCWRKEMNLRTMRDYDFPVEVFTSSLLFPYESDKEGHPVVYLRVAKYRKIPEMEEILRKYVIHLLDKMDSATGGNGIGMIFDLTGASTSSIDWAFLKYFTDTGTNYFPYSIKYVLIYNLPWYLNAIQKVALSLVPKENMGIIKFGKGSQIFDFVEEINLPDFLGGSCTRDYRYCPKGAPKLFDVLTKAGDLHDLQIDRIVSIFTEMSIPDKESEGKIYTDPVNVYDEKSSETLINTTKAIDVTQYAPEMNHTYLIIEPDLLLFADNSDSEHLSSQLLLRNVCDKVIAFKVKSNNNLKYRVTPAFGLILSKSTFKVNFIRLIGLEGIVRSNKIDKILIESQPVNAGSMSGSEFYNLWCNQDTSKQSIKCQRIVCKINRNSPIENRKVHRVHFKATEDVQPLPKHQEQIHQRMAVLQKKYVSFESQQNKTSLIFSITLTFFFIIMSYFLATHTDLKSNRYLRNNATLISSDQ